MWQWRWTKRIKQGALALGLLGGLASACGPGFALEVVTPTVPVATVAVTPTTPAPTDTSAPPEQPSATPTSEPSTTPPAETPPVEGLTYSAPDGIYWVDQTGQAHKIFDRPDAAISPDATQALYVDGDDIWLVTLGTGEPVNLTNTPDRVEHSPRWWPARPDLVVFGSYAKDAVLGYGPALFPSIVRTDGTGYRVLDDEVDAFTTIALSPDGHTLAYGIGPTAYLYDIDAAVRTVFDPQDYGVIVLDALPAPTSWSVGGPAFAPDGVHMSWTLGQYFADGHNNNALLIVDLQNHTYTLMHTYHIPPSDYIPAPGVWSPDGSWVAYYAFADVPADTGMWVAHLSGSNERYLGTGAGPVWQDDGGWLAYMADGGQTRLYQQLDWSAAGFDGPANAYLIGW